MRHHYLVCYDISDPIRLRRVHRTVRDFGDALQLSVFACQLGRLELAQLEAKLLDLIDARRDQVLVVRLGPAGSEDDGPPQSHTLGRALTPGQVRVVVL